MPRLALIVIPDDATAFLDITTETEDLVAARTVDASAQLLEDLDLVTTWVLSEHPGERPAWVESAQRLRDAAGLD